MNEMLMHVALGVEIISIVICIHHIYGKKITCKPSTIMLMFEILAALEIINYLHLSGIISLGSYIFLFVYCIYEFKSSVTEALISFILCMIVLSSIQFICFFCANIIDKEYLRNVVGNILSCIVLYAIIPTDKLHQLQKCICSKCDFVNGILAFMGMIIAFMLLQGKVRYKIQTEYFLFAVPAIILLLYMIVRWSKAQAEVNKMKEEMRQVKKSTEIYGDFLKKVRLRQHEFKNHMAAIFSTHYTCKSYEKLVTAQNEYCGRLMQENQFNSLLWIGDSVLAGYVYEKFLEAKADGIEVRYKAAVRLEKMSIPSYELIEMLGILLDNAREAAKGYDEKCMALEISEMDEEYCFTVRNRFSYVSYADMTEWFQYGKSGKGKDRGLGLYHLKCMCEEYECKLACRNEEDQEGNWIVFSLHIRK